MRRIGIFGGSFDPVHLGHIGLARDAVKLAGLEKVILIPAKLQPFKLDKKVTAGEDRLAMLQLAAESDDTLEVSDYEMTKDGVSYTYLTMRAMKDIYGPETKLYFITGTDSFLNIDKWKNAEELLSSYSFLVGTRPGYKDRELEECIDRISRDYDTEVKHINNIQVDVSSTEIRERIEAGISAADLIPTEVERYIREKGLYR